jgi:hypothetical protein
MIGAVLLMAASGCRTTAMKGTPFFSGEYGKRQGPVEDRVNLWPLMYYRDPALSVAWPFIEWTDDHLAFRPVFSVYGLDQPKREYNVLWPLAQFDRRTGHNRIFPAFWGEDYRAVFPLYWHHGHPLGEEARGFDALFPLWVYYRSRAGYNAYALWPFLNLRDQGKREGGRVWPLFGRYRDGDRRYDFALWPLWNQWREDAPLSKHQLLLPLFYRGSDRESTRFISLPYSYETFPDGDYWRCIFPLAFWARKDVDDWRFLSLLGGGSSGGGPAWWYLTPFLSGGWWESSSGSWWALGLLAHGEWRESGSSSYVFPLYHRKTGPDGSRFISLFYSGGEDSAGGDWDLVPPLWFHRRTSASSSDVTPIYSWGEEAETHRRWSCLFPLYYHSRSDLGSSLVTPLAGVHTDAAGRRWTAYPLFSTVRREADSGEAWIAGPVFHAEWDTQGASHHLFPLYYWNHRSETFVSPVLARWSSDDGARVAVVPPALSWYFSEPGRRDIWFALGLGHASWGEDAGASHLIPLFYRNAREHTFVSLFYISFDADQGRASVFPPLLSAYVDDGRDQDLWLLLGLGHHHRSGTGERNNGHLIPFYRYDREGFQTLLFGWWRDETCGWWYPLTPLFGVRTGSARGSWLFPLYSYRRNVESGDASGHVLWGGFDYARESAHSGLFPFYDYRRYATENNQSSSLNVALLGQWNDSCIRKGGGATGVVHRTQTSRLFPLWSARRESQDGEPVLSDRSVLLWLWDYLRESPSRDAHDYVRSRVLVRLWHYERMDDAVSMDLFPAVTYDRQGNRLRKVTFLWRAFRYERNGASRKVDVLFVPVWRS